MAILSAQEKHLYFPCVKLEGNQLTNAINRAELLAQSSSGANRQFLSKSYTESLSVLPLQSTFFLSYWPIGTISSVEARTVSSFSQNMGTYGVYATGHSYRRSQRFDGFGRPIPTSEWKTIEDYQLDENTGQILINSGTFHEARITYSAGWEADNPDHESDLSDIKLLLGQVLELVAAQVTFNNSALARGVSRAKSQQNEYQLSDSGGIKGLRGNETLLSEDLKAALAKYQPRENYRGTI